MKDGTKTPKRRKRATKSGGGKAAKVNALIVRAGQAKAQRAKVARALLARIARLKTRIAEDFYDLALCFHRLRTERHWAALDYSSFEECVVEEKLFDPEGARQMVAIIDAKVSRDAAIALGSYSAAYEALQITKATAAPDTVDGLVESDAVVAGTKVVGSSIRKLRAARLAVRTAEGTKPKRASAALARARRAAAALERALTTSAKVATEARAEATRPAPRVVIEIDVDAAEALVTWLAKHR